MYNDHRRGGGSHYGHDGYGGTGGHGHGRSGRGRDDRDGGGGGGGRDGRKGVPLSDLDPALTSVSHTVIGCARDVHMALGPGYEAAVYNQALRQEMTARGVTFASGHAFEVKYKGQVVGKATTDLFVAGRFLVAVLAKPGDVGSQERAQMRAALKAGDLELGLIINFAGRLLKDGLVRVLNPDKIPSLRGEGGEGEGGGERGGDGADGEGADHDARSDRGEGGAGAGGGGYGGSLDDR